MDLSGKRDFKVGAWWARPRLKEVHRGEEVVRIEARSLEVLRCLAKHAPEVVSKHQILDEIWGDTFVGDEVISHAIWELRRVFGDDAKSPHYIQTVAKKGYRLVAAVTWAQGDGQPEVGARIGPYEILEPLGSGAMGVVYKAKDVRLERTVALKFLAPDLTLDTVARKRFRQEAKLAAAMDHPHLGTLYEIGETHEGRLYLATAYYDGGTLKDKILQGPLPWQEAVRIITAVAKGLAEMHRSSMIHRDVKPANILLTRDGGVKLVDFGIARWLDATRLTRTGTSLGTPSYKSPEQSRGETVDHRTDLWSLGVVLFEATSGQRPFAAEYEQAVVHAILQQAPPSLKETGVEVPETLEVALARTLAKDPADRFQNAERLIEALERLGVKNSAAMPGAKHGAGHRQKRSLKSLLTAALVASLVALLGYFAKDLFTHPEPTEAEQSIAAGSHYELSDSLTAIGSAIAAYRAALKFEPENPEALARLGLALIRCHMQAPDRELIEEARQRIQDAAELAPNAWITWLGRAKLAYFDRRYEEAVAASREAVDRVSRREPDRDLAWALLGESLIATGAIDKGLEALHKATKSDRGQLRSRLILARRLTLLGRKNKAVVEYLEVLRRDPENIKALTNLGLLFLDLGREREALPHLQEAVRLEPNHSHRHNNLGTCYYYLGVRVHARYFGDAAKAFEEAVRLDPDYANAHFGLGDALEALGQHEGAALAFEAALLAYNRILDSPEEGSPQRYKAFRALCLARLGRFEEAIAEIEALERVDPDSDDWTFEMAQIVAMAGHDQAFYDLLRLEVSRKENIPLFDIDPAFRRYRDRDDATFRAILDSTEP